MNLDVVLDIKLNLLLFRPITLLDVLDVLSNLRFADLCVRT